MAAGGEVWFGDETTLREFPPLRGAWAKRGEPAVVLISGRNARRVLHGALNAATGELVQLVRERSRQDDCAAFVEALGPLRPTVPKRLIGDTAPPHHPKRVLAAAEAVHMTIVWLPFRAPELMPCSAWRGPLAADEGGRRHQSRLRQRGGVGGARRGLARCPPPSRPLALVRPPEPEVSGAIHLGPHPASREMMAQFGTKQPSKERWRAAPAGQGRRGEGRREPDSRWTFPPQG